MPVASTLLVFAIVNCSVAVPPGVTGSSVNTLVNVRPETSRSALAAGATVVNPDTVDSRVDVVFVYSPGRAVEGT